MVFCDECCYRSYSEPQYNDMQGFRESPDVFHTYHGTTSGAKWGQEGERGESPPPGFIDEPSTPLPVDIGGQVEYVSQCCH